MKLSPETQVSAKYGFIFLSLISLSGLQKLSLESPFPKVCLKFQEASEERRHWVGWWGWWRLVLQSSVSTGVSWDICSCGVSMAPQVRAEMPTSALTAPVHSAFLHPPSWHHWAQASLWQFVASLEYESLSKAVFGCLSAQTYHFHIFFLESRHLPQAFPLLLDSLGCGEEFLLSFDEFLQKH